MNTTVDSLRPYLQINNNEWTVMGYSLTELTETYKLPLHISCAPVIRNNLQAFKKVLQELYPKGLIRYAVKACTHPEVLKIVREEGAGIDASSANEMQCGIDAGINPEDIDLNGNCKEDELIEKAMKLNTLFVADSFEEFDLIHQAAEKTGTHPRVILRISGYELGTVTASSVFTAGHWTKFGAPLKEIPAFITTLDNYPRIEFLGFHTHIGSQITDVEPYRAVLGKMIELGHLLKETGRKCEIINIGGGFPISYLDRDSWEYMLKRIKEGLIAAREGAMDQIFAWENDCVCLDADCTTESLHTAWKGEKFYSPWPGHEMVREILTGTVKVRNDTLPVRKALKDLGEPYLVIEPGRSIAENAGITLARVGHVRTLAWGHNLTTLEMGVMSHCDSLVEPAMKTWDIVTDPIREDSVPFETFIGGNLCFSGDMIARYKVILKRKPQRGDILMIRDTGAYTSNFMAANANSFARPARLLINEDRTITQMKSRDTYKEIFS